VPVERKKIWDALVDPALLPELTPFLKHIHADGEHWRWEMQRIPVLATALRPEFTERMTFTPHERIEFTHAPPDGTSERTGVEGWYTLDETGGGTLLRTSLEICIDVPLPRSSGFAVRGVMRGVIDRMGDRFAANLLRHLGVDRSR
jgi:hypothetical protein